MLKRLFSPFTVLAVLAVLVSSFAVEEHLPVDDDDVIQPVVGPAPPSDADSLEGRLGVKGRPTVEDWNRWERRHSGTGGRP